MPEYSNKIIDSIKIFKILSADISGCMFLIEDKNNKTVMRLAFKSMYIDIRSFIDELEGFIHVIRSEPFDDYEPINKFLILSHQAIKILYKSKTAISKLRNTIFAHNYRDKKNNYTDPLLSILLNFDEAPILPNQLIYLGKLIQIISSLVEKSFNMEESIVYSDFKKGIEEFELLFPAIEELKSCSTSTENIQRDIYILDDSLKSNNDNYKIISRKIKCKMRDERFTRC